MGIGACVADIFSVLKTNRNIKLFNKLNDELKSDKLELSSENGMQEVFDLKEVLREKVLTIGENMDMSVGSTLVRNIVTTVTTVCAVLTIIVVSELFGLTSLRTFAIPMAFGLISGAVSSLFVSGPLWVIYKERTASKPKKNKKRYVMYDREKSLICQL